MQILPELLTFSPQQRMNLNHNLFSIDFVQLFVPRNDTFLMHLGHREKVSEIFFSMRNVTCLEFIMRRA